MELKIAGYRIKGKNVHVVLTQWGKETGYIKLTNKNAFVLYNALNLFNRMKGSEEELIRKNLQE